MGKKIEEAKERLERAQEEHDRAVTAQAEAVQARARARARADVCADEVERGRVELNSARGGLAFARVEEEVEVELTEKRLD